MKAVRAYGMAVQARCAGVIRAIAGAVGVRKAENLIRINDLQSMSDRFIGGRPGFAAMQHLHMLSCECCIAAWGGYRGRGTPTLAQAKGCSYLSLEAKKIERN